MYGSWYSIVFITILDSASIFVVLIHTLEIVTYWSFGVLDIGLFIPNQQVAFYFGKFFYKNIFL